MALKVTLSEVYKAGVALGSLDNEGTMSAKASYRLSKIIKEAQDIEEERKKLIKKHGSKKKDGSWIVGSDKLQEFKNEWNDFLGEEISIEVKPVTLDMLEKARLTPTQMCALNPFIKDE